MGLDWVVMCRSDDDSEENRPGRVLHARYMKDKDYVARARQHELYEVYVQNAPFAHRHELEVIERERPYIVQRPMGIMDAVIELIGLPYRAIAFRKRNNDHKRTVAEAQK